MVMKKRKRGQDVMVESEKGRMLRGLQRQFETGFGGCEEVPDDWLTTATVIRETVRCLVCHLDR